MMRIPLLRQIAANIRAARSAPRQRGEGVTSLAIGLPIVALSLTFGAVALNEIFLVLKVAGNAAQVKTIETAAVAYLANNISTISTSLGSGPVQITIAQMQTQVLNGALTGADPYGGTYSAEVCLTSNGLYKVVVESQGGLQVTRRYAGLGAMLIGGQGGGYQSYTASTVAVGSWGGYSDDLSTCLTGALMPSQGKLVAIDTYTPSVVGAEGFQVVGTEIVANGDLIPIPTCAGTLIPRPFFGLAKASADASGTAWFYVSAQALKIGSNWQAVIDVQTPNGTVTPGSAQAQATATIACSPF